MPIFRTLPEILSDAWSRGIETTDLPLKEDWLSKDKATINDINTWEQIYHQPGNIGVYAAWSPFVELYIITYDLFLNTPTGIEIFDSSEKVSQRLLDFEIKLPTNIVWV